MEKREADNISGAEEKNAIKSDIGVSAEINWFAYRCNS